MKQISRYKSKPLFHDPAVWRSRFQNTASFKSNFTKIIFKHFYGQKLKKYSFRNEYSGEFCTKAHIQKWCI